MCIETFNWTSSMSVSVVVPNYNHADVLADALRSILAQDPRPEEVIVVDDMSTDNSLDVIERLRRRHPEIRLLRHERNLGPPAALNSGLRLAKGDYIAFVGADDLVLPGLLREATDQLARHPAAALACSEVALVRPDGRVLGFRPIALPSWRTRYLTPEEVVALFERSDNWIVGSSTVYRKARLSELGGFDESLGSFCDGMVVRQLALTHGFCFVPQTLAVWQRSPTSYSSATSFSIDENSRILSRAIERFEVSLGPAFTPAFRNRFIQRWRFGTAVSMVLLKGGEVGVDQLVAGIGGNDRDRRVFRRLAARLGRGWLGRIATLGWIVMRTRPMRAGTLLANLLRHMVLYPVRARRLRRMLHTMGFRRSGSRTQHTGR